MDCPITERNWRRGETDFRTRATQRNLILCRAGDWFLLQETTIVTSCMLLEEKKKRIKQELGETESASQTVCLAPAKPSFSQKDHLHCAVKESPIFRSQCREQESDKII